jgi:hypothetical protein
MANNLNVKIFTADIIYHLFDQFTAYMEVGLALFTALFCSQITVCLTCQACIQDSVRRQLPMSSFSTFGLAVYDSSLIHRLMTPSNQSM